jgi:molecular chaperone GrpE
MANGKENQAARSAAANHQDDEQAKESSGVRVTDKRRFTPEGEPVNPEAAEAKDETPKEGTPDVAQLLERVAEAERKREEAERTLREVSEKFNQAQKKMQAETDSMRQRLQRNYDQKLDAAKGDIIASLLDTLDNLRRAVWAAERAESKEPEFRALLDGVKATASLFDSKMREHGLTPVTSEGEEFNPEFHEAVEIVAVPPEQDNHVVAEFQPGYKYGDKLLRPARVRVGRSTG